MGDRANVVLTGGGERAGTSDLVFYTHWNGSELPRTVQAALERGRDRWNDPQYLNRIIFSEMIQEEVMELTGFGIATGSPWERFIKVDHARQVVTLEGSEFTFEEFVALDPTDVSF